MHKKYVEKTHKCNVVYKPYALGGGHIKDKYLQNTISDCKQLQTRKIYHKKFLLVWKLTSVLLNVDK